MKLSSTRMPVLTILLIFLCQTIALSQSNYEFKGAALKSGTELTVGAVYSFADVKVGTDATITITAITGGISITNIDGGGGFDRAFQPVISVPDLKNGYIEFQIDFFVAGTSTPEIQAEVPITPIDVDGQMYSGLPLYEFDEVEMPNGYTYFQYAGSELTMINNVTWVRGKNNAAVDYAGIDTAQKTVMFTTVNANISTIKLRVGADNQSNTTASRLRSVYFQRFSYPYHEVLASKTLVSFSGHRTLYGIELTGVLANNSKFDKVMIERSRTASAFSSIGELEIEPGNSRLAYADGNAGMSHLYYRLRFIHTQTGDQELSNTVMIKAEGKNDNPEITTSILQPANPVLTVRSQLTGEANLRVYDLSGRSLTSSNVRLNNGTNIINLPPFNAGRGYLLLVLETKNNPPISRKVLIQ